MKQEQIDVKHLGRCAGRRVSSAAAAPPTARPLHSSSSSTADKDKLGKNDDSGTFKVGSFGEQAPRNFIDTGPLTQTLVWNMLT